MIADEFSATWPFSSRRSVFRQKHTRPGRRAQHFPAFLAGAGRPLLASMIDYSVFFPVGCSARDQLFPVPLAARPLLSISAFRAKFGLGVIWLSEVRVGALFQGNSCRATRRARLRFATAPKSPCGSISP